MDRRYTTFRADSTVLSSNSSSRDNLPTTFEFVIAGGSYAAIHAVKIFCKHVIPKAVQQNSNFKARITVIAPNKETYWNVAAVRLISDPSVLESHGDQIFFSLEQTLRKYMPKKHELQMIQGKVLSVDSEINMVTYMKTSDVDIPEEMQDYYCHSITFNKLVLATGAASSSPAFKLNGSTELTKAALRDFQEATQHAKTICIVGAGGAGVELAGELGCKFGKTKKITLYSGFDGTLDRLRPKIAEDAMAKLKSMGVEVVLNYRAISTAKENQNFSFSYPSLHAMESTDTCPAESIASMSEMEDDQSDVRSVKSNWFRNLPQRSLSGIHLRKKRSHDHIGNHPPPLSTSPQSNAASDHCDLYSIQTPTTPSPTRTMVEFRNGAKRAFDCYIPTTGNVPNSSFLPRSSLDPEGYVLVDPYLRMSHNNPYNDIYVYGDLISGGNQNIIDICGEQKQALKATLLHDILGNLNGTWMHDGDQTKFALRRYKHTPVTYYVPISHKDGVGQTMYGLPIPGFVVSIVKGKTFRVSKSKRYLGAIKT